MSTATLNLSMQTTRNEPLADLHPEAGRLDLSTSPHWPAWFVETQRAAWEEFQNTPAPKRTDESWRFSKIQALDLNGYHLPGPVANETALIAASQGVSSPAARFVVANNRFVAREIFGLPEGVIALPMEEAIRQHEDLFRSYFLQQPVELGSHKYAKLHHALLQTGLLLYVPAGVQIADPIEVFYWVEGEHAAVFPHTLIICGEGASVRVLDYFRSADGKPALACGVNDLHLSPSANLEYYSIQDWSEQTLAFHLNSTVVEASASSTACLLNFGGGFVRGESLSRLRGPEARSLMFSLNPVSGERMVDQRTLQKHDAPGAFSDLLYHNSLDDRARTIFAGLIQVAEGAHRTDAYQKVRNLLLSDEAEANSMPGLEILADNVRCTHGATSGEINPEEIFYMQARGLSQAQARRIIVGGFFDSLLERLPSADLRNHLSGLMRRHLGLPDPTAES